MYRITCIRRSVGYFIDDLIGLIIYRAIDAGDYLRPWFNRWGDFVEWSFDGAFTWLENRRLLKRMGKMMSRDQVAWWAYTGPIVLVMGVIWLVASPAIFTAAYGKPIHLLGMGEHTLTNLYLLIAFGLMGLGIFIAYLGGLIRKLERDTLKPFEGNGC